MIAHRIDVHQHLVPPFWVDGLRLKNAAHRPPAWSPQAALAFKDARGIAFSVLSLTAPALGAWADDERRDMARRVNDYAADLHAQWPRRFGQFATLPLPDIDGALRELRRAFDVLHADGVVLLSNYGDRFLGDALFEPLWQELDRRAAVVFIHPTRTALAELEGIPAPIADFPFATTRTAVHMVFKGVMDRYPRMRVILSHAGGFLPYAAHRIATCAGALPNAPDGELQLAAFRRFYFDTALSSAPNALPSLTAFADPARILFGSDFPYAPGGASEPYTALLDDSPLLDAAQQAAIAHANARPLFGRAGERTPD